MLVFLLLILIGISIVAVFAVAIFIMMWRIKGDELISVMCEHNKLVNIERCEQCQRELNESNQGELFSQNLLLVGCRKSVNSIPYFVSHVRERNIVRGVGKRTVIPFNGRNAVVICFSPSESEPHPHMRLASRLEVSEEELLMRVPFVYLHAANCKAVGESLTIAAERVGSVFDQLNRRNVILVGTETACAFGIEFDSWMDWKELVVDGYDGVMIASVPHPSSANRWWNDRNNVEAAKEFFYQSQIFGYPYQGRMFVDEQYAEVQ